MALNTTRTAPQKSFGRRPGPGPQASTPQPPAPPPVTDVLKDAQPASNWLSEIAGQSRPAAPPAAAPVAADRFTDAPAASLDAFHVIGRGLKVMSKNPVTFLAVLAAIALPEQFVAYLPVSLGASAAMIGPVFTTLGCMALYIAAFHGALAGLKGETVNLDDCLRAVARTPASAYGAIAMTVSFLSLMLIVPAIGFAGRWALAAPVAIVEGGDARARSVALTASHRAQLRLLVLILAGLTLLSALLAMSLSPGAMVSALAGDWLFPMLLTMFAAVAGAVLYSELVPAGAAATA